MKVIFIIALDEVDALIKAKGDGLLYELTRVNETLCGSKVSLDRHIQRSSAERVSWILGF